MTPEVALDQRTASSPWLKGFGGCRIRACKLTSDPLPSVPRLTPTRVPSCPPSPRIPSAPGRRQHPWAPLPAAPHPTWHSGERPRPPPAPLGGDTAAAQGGTAWVTPSAAARRLHPHAGPAVLSPRLPAREREGSLGTRQPPTCQHAQGPPATPHGRDGVSGRGAAGRASHFLTAGPMGKLAF